MVQTDVPASTADAPPDWVSMADWERLRSELLWAYDHRVDPQYLSYRDSHPSQSALLMEAGRVRIASDASVLEAEAGQWIFPQRGPRRQHFTEDARVLSVRFKLNWVGNQPLFDSRRGLVLDSATVPGLERQTRRLLRVVNRYAREMGGYLPVVKVSLSGRLAIQQAFDAWLAVYVEVLREAGFSMALFGQMDERLLHAVNILDGVPLRDGMDGRVLATEVGLSVSQLDRLFIREFGVTPRQYLESRKVEVSKELLTRTQLPVKHVGFEMGFGSLASFSRWFHQKVGASPRAYQRAHARAHPDEPTPTGGDGG